MSKELKHISKFLSLVLRHRPEEIGLSLDENGWANVEELISRFTAKGTIVDLALLTEIVETNDKKRFAFNESKTMIRANQGHSIDVDINLQPAVPPEILYHGTAMSSLESILVDGLNKQSRQHVHLCSTSETAKTVGGRHGKPVVLNIRAGEMAAAGFIFYLSENQVWLTDHVPANFIEVPASK